MAKTNKKKVSGEKQKKANWMWIERFFYEIDDLKERINRIEKFLGGQENIRKVLKDCEKQTQTQEK